MLSLSLVLVSTGLDQVYGKALDNCPHPPFSSAETGKPNILISWTILILWAVVVALAGLLRKEW